MPDPRQDGLFEHRSLVPHFELFYALAKAFLVLLSFYAVRDVLAAFFVPSGEKSLTETSLCATIEWKGDTL